MKTLMPFLLLILPLAAVSGEIQPYQAKEIQPYQAREIQPYQAKEIQPYRSTSQPHVFTREEREQMHQNDVKAGRTHESMSKNPSNGQRAKGSYNPDPYNTGGWNYNTNQPASPIWNPNRQ